MRYSIRINVRWNFGYRDRWILWSYAEKKKGSTRTAAWKWDLRLLYYLAWHPFVSNIMTSQALWHVESLDKIMQAVAKNQAQMILWLCYPSIILQDNMLGINTDDLHQGAGAIPPASVHGPARRELVSHECAHSQARGELSTLSPITVQSWAS